MKIDDYLHLYLGCPTNAGLLSGISHTSYFLRLENGEIVTRNIANKDQLKPILRKLSDMTIDESAELNKRGISIGQRKGYSFTPEAFLYLLAMQFDLFNLIDRGLALDAKNGLHHI